MWGSIILVATIIAIIFYRAAQRPSSFPPGPLSLPIVGNAHSLVPSVSKGLAKFQKKFGDICSFKVFGKWTILISDPAVIKTVSADSNVAGRPNFYLFIARNEIISGKDQPLGIIGTIGDIWKNQRRFTLRSLKDLGFGRHSIEPIIQSELQELGDYFESKGNQKICVGNTYNRSIINVIWALVIGKRFSYDDAQLQELVDKVNKMIQSFNPFDVALNFPIIKKILPNLEIYKKVDGYMKDLLLFIEKQMEEYEKELDDNDDPGCYLGAYLKDYKEAVRDNKETPLDMHHLKANVIELFIAGSETTSTTLWFATYFMAMNPKVQQKVQQELDDIIGPENTPGLEHIDRLPYTTATIYEIQRKGDILPIAVPHSTTADVSIGGYNIPKDTDVLLNLSHVFSSPKYWKYPEKFYPEHFLTPDGKINKPDFFLPFGAGKRVCLGESLARLELFLFFTNLMKRFTWKMTDDPVTWETATVVSRPPNFTVFASPRRQRKV